MSGARGGRGRQLNRIDSEGVHGGVLCLVERRWAAVQLCLGHINDCDDLAFLLLESSRFCLAMLDNVIMCI